MSTQVLLDHDLSANARRILENKGADVTIADQTVTLGNGNLFRILPGSGEYDDELAYITTAGWPAGSTVKLEVTREEDEFTLITGTSPPGGTASLLVDGGSQTLSVGQFAILVLGELGWLVARIGGGSTGGGGFVKTTTYNGGTSGATFTKQTGVNWIHVYGRAGGGGGGSASGYTNDSHYCPAVGAGGAQGGKIDRWINMTGINTISGISVGVGGVGTVVGTDHIAHTGATGGDTVFTVGGTTYTAKGGNGGEGMIALDYATYPVRTASGGTPVAGTNDTSAGAAGHSTVRYLYLATFFNVYTLGNGGGEGGGAAPLSSGAGNPGTGTEGGGGSGAQVSGMDHGEYNGGAGAPGTLRFDEYIAPTLLS